MHVDTGIIIALAIVVHAWTSRIVSTPRTASTIGWFMNGLFFLVLALKVRG